MSSPTSQAFSDQLSGLFPGIRQATLARNLFEAFGNQPTPDYNAIPEIFQPFLQLPDPDYYTPHIEKLNTAMGYLQTSASSDPFDQKYPGSQLPIVQPALGSLLTAGDAIPEWQGVAADNFRTNYLNKFNTCVPNDYTLVAMLKATLEAHQATFQAAQHDILNIATAAQYAMNQYGDSSSGSPVPIILTVVGAITSILTAPIGGEAVIEPLTALAIAGVGAAANIGAAFTQSSPSAPPPPNAFSAKWAYQVFEKVQVAIGALRTQIDINLVEISSAVQQTLRTLSDNAAVRAYFEAPGPDLTGFTSGSAR